MVCHQNSNKINFSFLIFLFKIITMRVVKITPSITKRESIALEKYLNEISRIDLLTTENEVDLIERYRNGDNKALNILVKANLRFVISVAKQYQNQGLSLEDLINEGNLGLIKAAQRFDASKGFKFISYAVWWIRQSIIFALSENSRLVRMPNHKISGQVKIGDAIRKFMQEFERDPTVEELAEMMNISAKDSESALNMGLRHISLDEPVHVSDPEDNICFLDLMKGDLKNIPDSKIQEKEGIRELYNEIERLDSREKIILKAYFGLDGYNPMKLEDIGEICGLTRERVRQIKENALKRPRSVESKERLSCCSINGKNVVLTCPPIIPAIQIMKRLIIIKRGNIL